VVKELPPRKLEGDSKIRFECGAIASRNVRYSRLPPVHLSNRNVGVHRKKEAFRLLSAK
jgi:hypothetical protein